MHRRDFLRNSTLLAAAGAFPALALSTGAAASELSTESVNEALANLVDSELVYLSPYQSSGALSRCQAEVWYVTIDTDILVCTASDSWRARAPKQGLTRTKVWVGDYGVWRNGKYKTLPAMDAVAGIETSDEAVETALARFGDKYRSGWGTWGPRFRNGLADGSRTMLRYQPG